MPPSPMSHGLTGRRALLVFAGVSLVVGAGSGSFEASAVFQPDSDRHFRRLWKHLVHLPTPDLIGRWARSTAHLRTLISWRNVTLISAPHLSSNMIISTVASILLTNRTGKVIRTFHSCLYVHTFKQIELECPYWSGLKHIQRASNLT